MMTAATESPRNISTHLAEFDHSDLHLPTFCTAKTIMPPSASVELSMSAAQSLP
jgi:hypothetical protein